MSSSDFSKVLIRDERLDCHDSIPFAVYRSGTNVTVSTFNAISESASSIVFNVQVPSETTVLDRRVIWESTLDFDVTFEAAAANQRAVDYGLKQAFCPWPLHTLCNTQQATINNNSVTMNTYDVLPALSRMHDMRELQRYNGMTPLVPDNVLDSSAFFNANANTLASYNNVVMDPDYRPRGSVVASITFALNSNISPTTGLTVATGATVYHVRATIREPLLLSPFLYAHPFYNGQGFYGLQNLNLVFNLNQGIGCGLWRCMPDSVLYNPVGLPKVSGLKTTGNKLIFNFLTPKPSDLLAARNVVPYWEMPRYLKTSAVTFAAYSETTQYPAGSVAPTELPVQPVSFVSQQVQSQSLQLNQIPDKLIIFLRRKNGTIECTDTNASAILQSVSINWNNQSGILASATQDQLWRFSVEAGSTQTWEEFSGVANVYSQSSVQPFSYNNGTVAGGNFFKQQKAMVGSYLMLDFAKHINITEDYYAPGSLGNFNLQVNMQWASNALVERKEMDLVIITVNSGLFVTEKGQSATYTGILTKDDVLSASSQEPHSDAEARRLVGGFSLAGLLSSAKKIAGNVSKYLPAITSAASMLPEGKLKSALNKGLPIAGQVASKVSGMGASGGMYGSGRGSQVFNIKDRLV
jgi:hypothetical protein